MFPTRSISRLSSSQVLATTSSWSMVLAYERGLVRPRSG